MKSLKFIFVLALIAISLNAQSSEYKKVLNTIDPEAKCLDGTPPVLYMH